MGRLQRSVILTLATANLGLGPAAAQDGRPKLVAEQRVHLAGMVDIGEIIRHDFVIKNEGTADLELAQVETDCGCTATEFQQVIPPGASGKIHVEVDTATFTGPIDRRLAVLTNDPETPRLILAIKADVQPQILVRPGYARYLAVQKEPSGEPIGQLLWTEKEPPFEVLGVRSPYPFLEVRFREATEAERHDQATGKQWWVETFLDKDRAPVGPLADYVEVETTHPRHKVVRIPVSGIVRPILAVTPPEADLGALDLSEPTMVQLHVKNFTSEAVDLGEIEPGIAGVEGKIEVIEKGREYLVTLTLQPGMAKGPFAGTVRIHTTSPKQPLVLVAIRGTVL